MSEEIKIYNKDIDVKFTRLSKPNFNILDTPLSGLYNDIDNKEYSNFPLKNLFKNFSVSPQNYIGVENLFQLKSAFGKLLTGEYIEGLVILTNISDRDIILSNLEISFKVEGVTIQKEKNDEPEEASLAITLPGVNNSLLLLPNQSHSIKINNYLKYAAKYTINVIFTTKSSFYNQQLYNIRQRTKVKENHRDYFIKDNQIEYKYNKIFFFIVNYPFVVKETFKMNQMKEEYLIEINIKNQSIYMLTMPDLIIIPKKRNDIHLKPIVNLNEIQSNENSSEIGGFENNSKILSLNPEEEVNLLFRSDSSEIFLNEKNFILCIRWLNVFDFVPKTFEYEFKNGLEIFNDYFAFQIVERPMGNIIQNNNFPIVFQFINKQLDKAFLIEISEYKNNENIQEQNSENNTDNNKNINDNIIIENNNRNINIQIKEYKIEINNNSPKSNVNIVCKSDKLGIVFFPKIQVTLFEIENNEEKKISEYIYKDLLSFNCVQNVQLI